MISFHSFTSGFKDFISGSMKDVLTLKLPTADQLEKLDKYNINIHVFKYIPELTKTKTKTKFNGTLQGPRMRKELNEYQGSKSIHQRATALVQREWGTCRFTETRTWVSAV